MNPLTTGMCWYYEKQWEKIRAISQDRDSMPKTYSDWLWGAEKDFNELTGKGITVHKVYVDADQLALWASRNLLPINAKTRADFGTFILANRQGLTDNI